MEQMGPEGSRLITRADLDHDRFLTRDELKAPYGYCPNCGGKGTTRERCKNGNDKCENGHTYPSSSAMKTKLPLNNFQEYQYKQCSSAMDRQQPANQYPQNVLPPKHKRFKPKKKRLEEALSGIATSNDIQPSEALKGFMDALKHSGLDKQLRAAGVEWNLARPGGHLITFIKGDIPVLQRETLKLADKKELASTLSALRSIAQGKPPEAETIELDQAKELAAKARERSAELDDLATRFSPLARREEEMQPVQEV